MTTILTEIGWEDESQNLLGTWTRGADIVNRGDSLLVESDIRVNTLKGNDELSGNGFIGIENKGILDLAKGNDRLRANSFGVKAIVNDGTIRMGNGADVIEAGSIRFGIAIENNGIINTGRGDDLITGNAFGGIHNNGIIRMGNGRDTLSGNGGFVGISNKGTIDTGRGDDLIFGIGGIGPDAPPDILNEGTIRTGWGNDIVDSLANGFDGDGEIYLNRGRDVVKGFGQQYVNGGWGYDTAELGIEFNCQVGIGNISNNSLEITFDSETMTLANVEKFVFTNEEFTFDELIDV